MRSRPFPCVARPAPRPGHGGRRPERGAVTAEAAILLPLLAAVALALTWALALAATQARVVDAAREVARAVARDEPRESALALGRQVAPVGSEIEVGTGDGTVRVDVVARVHAPLGLLGFLPSVEVSSRAVAAQEEPS